MLLNTKERWEPEEADVIAWSRTYPAVDVFQELRAMESWLDANPTKRKTKGGIKRFVNSWLSRSQDRGGSSPAVIGTQAQVAKLDPQGITAAPISLKSLTMDMQLTDITWLDPQNAQEMKQYYLERRGFYFDGVLRNA
tara:strand:+ start:599 stop:1012 length:414 start_codon:yes stop_codon:yes gene_type:complete